MYDDYGFKSDFIKLIDEQGINKVFTVRATIFFNAAEETERAYNKDLCDFNITQIIALYKNQYTASLETLLNMTSVFKRYTYYCIDNNRVADGINHYEEITNEIAYTCLNPILNNDKIISRAELLKQISGLANASEKFLALATFEGLSKDSYSDLVNLTTRDFKRLTVKLPSGRNLKVSKELYNYAVESENEYTYSNSNGDRLTTIKFKQNDHRILKDLHNVYSFDEKRYKINLSKKLARLNKKFDSKAFTYGHLIDSGRIDLIKQFMAEDKSNDPRKTILEHKDEITERYGPIVSANRFVLKYEKYLKQQD